MDFPNYSENRDKLENLNHRARVQGVLRAHGKEAEVQMTRNGLFTVTPEGERSQGLYKDLIGLGFKDLPDGQFVSPKIKTPWNSSRNLPWLLYILTFILVILSVLYFLIKSTTNYWYFGRAE